MLRTREGDGAGGGDRLQVRDECGLRAPVRTQHAGLPTGEIGVVAQLEVEERADRRLAIREPHGGGELRALLLLRDRLSVGLRAGVEGAAGGRRALETVLHVPDADATLAGDGLARAVETLVQRREQPVEVALVDRVALVPGAGNLRGGLRVGVVTD